MKSLGDAGSWALSWLLAAALFGCGGSSAAAPGGGAGAGSAAGSGSAAGAGGGAGTAGGAATAGSSGGAGGASAGNGGGGNGSAGNSGQGATDAGPDAASCDAGAGFVPPPFDIVLVTSTSARIHSERYGIDAQLDALVSQLDAKSTQPGVHLVSIQATDQESPASTVLTATNYLYLSVASFSDPLQLLIDDFDSYIGFLRPGAEIEFVVVDEADSNYQGGADAAERARFFSNDMTTKLLTYANAHGGGAPHSFRVNAVVSLGGASTKPCVSVMECCDGMHSTEQACIDVLPLMYNIPRATNIDAYCSKSSTLEAAASAAGATYTDLAEQTGGVTASSCQTDWVMGVKSLGDALLGVIDSGCKP